MEELATAPPPRRHRERRHRRKASDAAAAALAASFGDVFSGPPRFATGAPADYAEVFSGVAASCSIPYLDLPPASAAAGDDGAGWYGEIFGRFDFGDFAAPYDETLAGPEGVAEEIASPSGSSRSSIRKESDQLDFEPSIPYQHYPNADSDQHFDEEHFCPASFPLNGEQKFSMSYNKSTRGRPDDIVEMTTCIVEPSISYVVDSCNLSNDSEMSPVMDSGTHADGMKEKMRPPIPASTTIKSANSDSVLDSCNLSNDSEMNHVPVMDSGTLDDGVKGKVSPLFPASSSMRSANNASVVDQQQHIPTCLPISENICEDENYNKRSSTHSVSSEEAPSPDYPFLRVPNTSFSAAPIKVQPPPMPPSKLFNKKGSNKIGDSDVNPNSAAAAMKEAMEFAEARLKAAKELMERKGDSFKLRKKPAHRRSTRSTEIKESKSPDEAYLFEEKLNTRRLVKEENQNKGLDLLDKNRDGSAVMFVDCDHDNKGIVPPGKPQEMLQNGSKLEQLGKWTSDAEFVELIGDDQKCRPNPAPCEGNNDGTTNSFTKLDQFEKEKAGGFAGELKRFRKLWFSNDTTELRTERVNLVKDGIASVEVEHKVPRPPEVPFSEETVTYQEPANSHFKHCPEVGISLQSHDDARSEISCMNSILAKVHVVPEMPSPFLEACISDGHANDNKIHFDASTEETPLVRKSNQDNNKVELELPCADEVLCISARSQISQEHPNLSNIDETKETQVEISELEDNAESCETYEKEKLFNFVDVLCQHSQNERANEVTSGALIHEETKTFGAEEKAGAHEDFQDVDVDVDVDAGSPKKEASVTSGSASANANGNKNEEAEVLNVFLGDAEPNGRTCGTFSKDPYELQEPQRSSQPQDLENIMDRVEDIVSSGEEKETKESLLENVEKKPVEEVLNHECREGQRSMETGIHKRQNDIYAEINIRSDRDGNTCHSVSEVITNDGGDYAVKISTCSDNLEGSFSEACTSMRQLSKNAVSVSAEKTNKITPVLGNLEEDCTEPDREFLNEKCTTLEEGQKAGSKVEERDENDCMSNVRFKDRQSFYLDSDIIPRFAEDTAPDIVQNSSEERSKGKNGIKKTEGETEKEVLVRHDEDKEKECKMVKDKEQNKERWRRELEEEKEREMERAKDRLAVQRATREAHKRAFAEACAKAERIALERITSARQRAAAEAHEKEEKTAEAAAEKASREARMKAERAAVERATAEARERAIEKAKAAADAKERMERFRPSFKDSFKVTNQDNQQETQFQKSAFNNCGKSTGSGNEVVEVESALRHKAKLERQQRTAERAAKALAEKNMRDMLAQREQAERHRLAEFLDPEVKRWSNGKEGNLRALLSTLHYILGSDSGWQSVPLTDLITATGVKKAYRRATLCVHPDKLQQRGATIRQKYICEKVFDLLKEAWNKFNSEER